MQKLIKFVMKLIFTPFFICISSLFFKLEMNLNSDIKDLPVEYSIEEKHKILYDLGVDLSENHGLKISAEKFADISLIVLYCESGLNTRAVSADGYGSQGINQLTESTRKYLNIPSNILEDDFKIQVSYFKQFLISTKKIPRIEDSVSLHLLNFAPSVPVGRHEICKSSGGLVHLDFNKNEIIDREDFVFFQSLRVSENPYVKGIFEKYRKNV